MRRLIAVLPVLALLSACDGGGDPVNQALRDASAERQAATVADGAVSGPSHSADHEAAGPTPGDRAFAAAEAEMHRGMTQASGQTVDQAYVAKMIAHHQAPWPWPRWPCATAAIPRSAAWPRPWSTPRRARSPRCRPGNPHSLEAGAPPLWPLT